MQFIKYTRSDYDSCLSIFNENCPNFFADCERDDYIHFLKEDSKEYLVGKQNRETVCAFGMKLDPDIKRGRISWIMVSPSSKGIGLGTKMFSLVRETATQQNLLAIDIAASHLSASFFKKFGAETLQEISDGWGTGMHRIDMQLIL